MTRNAAPVEVFWMSGSQYSWRVLLTLEARGIPYTSRLIEGMKGDHKKPEFLALNPRGKVPVLRDGSVVLHESLAIMQYLERKYPENPVFGRTAEETGRIWRRISEFFSYLEGPAGRVLRPFFFGKSAEKADDIRAAAIDVNRELAGYEAGLSGAGWLVTGALSAADLAIYPFVMSLVRAAERPEARPFELGFAPLDGRYPGLAAWRRRIEALPGYERTYPPHWRVAA